MNNEHADGRPRMSNAHIPSGTPAVTLPPTNVIGLLNEAEEPTPWLVEGWLVESELAMLHGPAHVGKTYVVLDLGLRLAFGLTDFHGFPIAESRPVLYVPSEGRRGVSRRIGSRLRIHRPDILTAPDHAFVPLPCERWRIDDEGVPERYVDWLEPRISVPFERYEAPVDRSAPMLVLENGDLGRRSIERLRRTIRALGDQFGVPPVVIVDVVGDFAPGVDENSRDFGHAVSLLHPENLADGDATVVVVHHEGWTAKGRPRGHASLDGLVDARIGLEAKTNGTDDRPATLTYVKVSNPKQRSDDRHPPMILTLAKPTPELTNPVVTGRVHPTIEPQMLRGWSKSRASEDGGRSAPSVRISTDEASLLETVRGLAERPDTGGVVTLAELHEAIGDPKPTLSRRRDSLIKKGFLASDESRGRGGFVLTPSAFSEAEQ